MDKRIAFVRALRRSLEGGVASAAVLARDTSGNIAMLTAFMLVPILGMAGLGVDFWTKTNAQAELDAAADAATLAAINRTAALIRSNTDSRQALAEGRKAGLAQFAANVGKVPQATTSGIDLEMSVVGLAISAKATWTATSKTTFGAMVGVKSLALAGISQAEVTLPSYVKIALLLDNSASMGIGSTPEHQAKLHDLTNCAVACHLDGYFDPKNKNSLGNPGTGETSYQIAEKAGVVTRLDVLKAAIEKITMEAEQVRESADQFKIGLYTFSSQPQEILALDDPRASDMNVVRKAARSIELTRTGGGTHFERASKYLYDKVVSKTPRGDGTSAARPKVFVMLISDGVESYLSYSGESNAWSGIPYTPYAPTAPAQFSYWGYPWKSWFLQSTNPTFCSSFKSLSNVTVLPLQVTYIVPATKYQDFDPRFPWIKSNLIDSKHTDQSFQNCASKKEYAFKGSTPDEITDAVLDMFALTTAKSARLMK